MRILNEIHEELFKDSSQLKEKIDPIKPYCIGYDSDIIYNEKEHWIVYDFVKKKMFSKSFSREFFMLEMTNNYTEIKKQKQNDSNNVNIILNDNEMKDYLLDYKSNLKVEIGLTQKKILVVLDDNFNYKNKENDKDFNHIFYCIYQSYVKNEIFYRSSDEIEKIIYNPSLVAELNWVWFRKSKVNTFLDPKILKRAYTWIYNNQEDNFKFHLWTNLENKEELVEYFKEADPNQEFINNSQVIIHFYDELIELVNNFFKKNNIDNNIDNINENDNINNSSLLEDYKAILGNTLEKSVMVLKTDSIRCIILAMNGGWYADFNDTYSFCALKYIIDCNYDFDCENDNNTNTNDCMYFGSDEKGFLSNYILYSSKDNLEWKEKTIQIVKNSIDIYNNLFDANNINNLNFINEFNSIKNNLCDLLEKQIEKNEEIYFVEIIINETRKWRNQLFKIDNNFNKFGIPFDDKTIINLFNIIIDKMLEFNQNSILDSGTEFNLELKNQIKCELKDNLRIANISQFRRKKKVYWNNLVDNQKPVKFIPRIDEINLLRNFMIDFSLISNSIIYINIQSIMRKMNIGCLMTEYNNSNNSNNNNTFSLLEKNIFQISNCYVFNAFTFLTVIGHLGDGTCTGQDKNYELYNKLL